MAGATNKVERLVEIAAQSGTQTLDLSGNRLSVLPESLGNLTALTSLNLAGNELSVLPDWLGSLTALTTLDLKYNKLSVLPDWLGSLTALTTLNLSGNDLSVLPESLGNLTALSILHLSSNRLSVLPESLGSLTALTTLNLGNNELSALPDWLGSLTALTILNLRHTGLSVLPDSVGSLTALTTLNLTHTGLSVLPDWVGNLTALTTLDLSYNKLSVLPDWVGNLTILTALRLSGNRLSVLPESLGSLTALAILDLSYNELSVLPDWLGNLTALTTLKLSRTGVSELPDWLGNLTALTALHLSGNRLSVLPDWLGSLTALSTLNLGGNELLVLPESLGSLTVLSTLNLKDNDRLVSPPPEVVAGGAQSVLTFLRAGRVAGTRRQWRSRLVLVGQARAGKTTLVAALENRAFDPLQPSTEGLAVSTLHLAHPAAATGTDLDRVRMDLSVWDFGGQEIYHATHQFFLAARSLFLVVWDPNSGYENSRLQYWLNTVTARAPDAPILLVATHGAQRPADLPLADLQRRFPAIVGTYTVDSATGEHIPELRTAIADHAAGLPLMGAPWPTSWAAGAEAIRALPGTHTTVADVCKLLTTLAVAGTDQHELLAALNFLGDILHYPDDPRLVDTIVLQPQWLNERIARILDSKTVAARGGQLQWNDVNAEWADIEPVMREHFLTMMDRYDISYRVDDRDSAVASVVTALLPWDKPDTAAQWPESFDGREIVLSYQLNFIPPGIPTWFITRTRRYTLEHWRTGALLHDPATSTRALIQADLDDGILHLAARGGDLERFLPVLLAELAHSFGRYPGLTAKRFIRCPHPTDRWHSPHQYSYLHMLKTLLRDGSTISCPETGEDFDIAPMLAGISPSPTELAELSRNAEISKLEAMFGAVDQIHRIALETKSDTAALLTATVEAAGVRCPSVFTIRAVRRGPLRMRYQLRVCCQHNSGWHEVAGKEAAYDLRTLRTWASKVAPGIQTIAATAHAAAPLISLLLAGIALDLRGSARKDVVAARAHLTGIPGQVALLHQPPGADGLHQVTTPTQFAHTDADYRTLSLLFEALDAQRATQRRWGGLSAALDSNGHTIYLCPQHAAHR